MVRARFDRFGDDQFGEHFEGDEGEGDEGEGDEGEFVCRYCDRRCDERCGFCEGCYDCCDSEEMHCINCRESMLFCGCPKCLCDVARTFHNQN